MPFFALDAIASRLNILAGNLQIVSQSGGERGLRATNLLYVVNTFISDAAEFDKACSYTIPRYSHLFSTIDVGRNDYGLKIDLLLAIFYTFLAEFDLSLQGAMAAELVQFCSFVEGISGTLDPQAIAIIDSARTKLPVAILKSLVNSSEVKGLKDVPPAIKEMNSKIKEWRNELKNQTATVKSLQKTLERQTDAFNFVGLFNGFDKLARTKSKELRNARILMTVLAVGVLMPVLLDVSLLFTHQEQILRASGTLIGAFATVTFSTTLIIVYFYRVVLKTADSCKAQLLQIELRKTLCQFIQRYVKYADGLQGNKELLQKFESVIFAPISSSDDKAVSMFDGLDQLAGLIKAARAKPE